MREQAGSALPGIAPSNAYRCADDHYVLIGGNGDSIYRRLMIAIDRRDLADDPSLAHNDGRVGRVEEIDAAIESWTGVRSRDDVIDILDRVDVPVGKIYSIADISTDPQYLARQMLVNTVGVDGKRLKVPGIVPKLSATPGDITYPAPSLGQHTAEILSDEGWPKRTAVEADMVNGTDQDNG